MRNRFNLSVVLAAVVAISLSVITIQSVVRHQQAIRIQESRKSLHETSSLYSQRARLTSDTAQSGVERLRRKAKELDALDIPKAEKIKRYNEEVRIVQSELARVTTENQKTYRENPVHGH